MSNFENYIKIIRSRKRRTVELKITPEPAIVLRVPIFMSENEIKGIVSRHTKWIEKNFNRMNQIKKETPSRNFVSGEKFLYLGKYYTLYIVKSSEPHLKFNGKFILPYELHSNARREFVIWYKKTAFNILTKRVEYFSRVSGFSYNRIKITGAQKRWGSCSNKKNLSFSFRLVMAPLSIIDYVVVHELSHTVCMNHSEKFWNLVSSIMPDFFRRREWLKQNGYKLYI